MNPQAVIAALTVSTVLLAGATLALWRRSARLERMLCSRDATDFAVSEKIRTRKPAPPAPEKRPGAWDDMYGTTRS